MRSIAQFTTRLAATPPPGSRLRSRLTLPPTTPALGAACATHLPGWLAAMLQTQGIERLTPYQWHALGALQQGQHVCLAAPAGAGRGVVRLLTLYQSLATTGAGHALCIFPQKYRELEQFRTLSLWNDHLPPEYRLTAAMYDGDTPKNQRRLIKQSQPRLILTTPEMLHAGILAYHGGWRAFFQGLRYVIFPDLHRCAGALGAHLAHLWRRLYRLSRHYGARPQLLITSAPLRNIHAMAQAFSGQRCTVVCGQAWRRQVQSRLLLEVQGDVATIVEDLVTRLGDANLQPFVSPSGAVDVPAPRNPARPLGMVFPGVPGSLTRLHDMLARCANGPLPSVSILVVRGTSPLERYLLRYPSVYQTHWMQDVPLDPTNPLIVRQHLQCAAAELPLKPGESYAGVHGLHELIQQLAADQVIRRCAAPPQWVATQPQPHRRLRLRFYEPAFAVVHRHDGHLITTVPERQAFQHAFEGAVYQHAGESFHVERYLADRRRIVVRPTSTPYRTRGVCQIRMRRPLPEAATVAETFRVTYGTLDYDETLYAFERLDPRTQARLSLHAVANHQRRFHTQGTWIEVADTSATAAAMHTLVHAVLAALPLLLSGDTTPVKGGIEVQSDARPAATLVDAQAGGNGASACLYDAARRVLRVALQILLQCDCEQGCSGCVAGLRCAACADGAEPPLHADLDRQSGIALLQRMLGEVAPSFDTVADPVPPENRRPRHLYLCLSTRKSAAEVGGWQHPHLLGLGVAVTYDTQEALYRVYTVKTIGALLHRLCSADLIIGFNLRDFDYPVLQAYTDIPLASLPTLAILDDIRQALGFRLSFGHLLRETLGRARPDDSAQTLQWFREGAWDRLVEHGRRDVECLRQLVDYGRRSGVLWYRDGGGERRSVPVHWHIAERYG